MELYRVFEAFPRMRFVRKDWGYEIWFFNTEELCMKLLVIYPGYTCSYHEHPRKYEIFYILDSDDEGRVYLKVGDNEKPMHPGEHKVIERGTPHEFCVRGDKVGSLLEFSTEHRDDDSVRHTVSRLLSLGREEHEFMGELSGFNSAKVLLVGDVMYDLYWTGPTKGLSPEAPVPNIYPESMWGNARPGGVGNVVSNVLSLGGQAACVAYTGTDFFGTPLIDMMQSEGCNVDYMAQLEDRPTTTKIRIMDGPHHHCRVNFEREDDLDNQSGALMWGKYSQAVDVYDPDIIYFADYDKGLLCPAFLSEALQLAKHKGIPTIADPKLTHPWDFNGVTLYKPNVGRLATVLGRPLNTESDLAWAALQIHERINPDVTLITRGSFGMSLFQESRATMQHIPGKTVKVWELSGAGDTVGAVISLCMASGMDMLRSAEIANIAGSMVVQKAGTATLTQAELLEELKGAT